MNGQRVTLRGMWADVRMQTTVTAGDSILIWVDLEPHDPGLRLQERRVALDLTPLGRHEQGLPYPMDWVRLRDQYQPAATQASCCHS